MSDIPRDFVFTRYPASQGMLWLRAAYGMFKQHRAAWVGLVVAYFVCLFFVRLVPYVGPYAMTILKPVLAVGLLAAAWNQERGGTPRLQHLTQGFRTNLWALFAIGVFFVVGITIAVYASALVDGGKLLDVMSGSAALDEEQLAATLNDRQVQLAMLFSAMLSLPVVIATWWAPALVVFQDAGAATALAASLRAALANWKALAIYGLGVLLYGGVLPAVVLALATLLLPPEVVIVVVFGALVPYSLFFAATLHVSDYVSYRDVFHANETLAPLSRGN